MTDALRTRIIRLAATAVHDLVAHPLIGLTGGSAISWRIHDAVGEVATKGAAGTMLRVTGPGELVSLAHEHLTSLGWHAPALHMHESGRGCGGYSPPSRGYGEILTEAEREEARRARGARKTISSGSTVMTPDGEATVARVDDRNGLVWVDGTNLPYGISMVRLLESGEG